VADGRKLLDGGNVVTPAQVTQSLLKLLSLLTMPYYPSKKRSWKPGKGKGSGGPPKKKSLTATVSALAKIVKKDHKMIKFVYSLL